MHFMQSPALYKLSLLLLLLLLLLLNTVNTLAFFERNSCYPHSLILSHCCKTVSGDCGCFCFMTDWAWNLSGGDRYSDETPRDGFNRSNTVGTTCQTKIFLLVLLMDCLSSKLF